MNCVYSIINHYTLGMVKLLLKLDFIMDSDSIFNKQLIIAMCNCISRGKLFLSIILHAVSITEKMKTYSV